MAAPGRHGKKYKKRKMKKVFYLLFMVLLAKNIFAQAPQGINYQGVARTGSGAAMGNTNISLEIKIFTGDPNLGSAVLEYTETHSVLTDTFGLYSLAIGKGTVTTGPIFSQIPWSTGNKWVQVSIDPTNGSAYVLVARQQLLSVPYALYAETAGNGGGGGINGAPHNIPKINPSGTGTKTSLIFESADSSSIGINNPSPNPNAVLDIMNTGASGAAGKGLLIPRMTEAERTLIPVSALTHGLLVYQVNNPNVLSPQGFWYYDAISTSWLLLAPAQAVWTLAGNAPGANGFIGTLDGNDIVFKTGLFTATERMRVLNAGKVQFGDGSATNSYIFPAVAGASGDVLQLDPSGATKNLIWTPMSGGTSLWSHNTSGRNFLFPTNPLDSVGIGPNSTSPAAQLDVSSANGIAFQVSTNDTASPAAIIVTGNPNNTYPALFVNSSNTLGKAIYGLALDAPAFYAENTSDFTATIDAVNFGKHSVAYFHNTGINGSGPVLYAQTSDPTGYSAQFDGGMGIKTDGFELPTGAAMGFILQSNALGRAGWVDPVSIFGTPTWTLTGTSLHPIGSGNVGIGTTSPSSLLEVVGSNNAAATASVQNNGGGDGIFGSANGNGSGVFGLNSGTSTVGAGVTGFSNGAGNAGFFQVASQTNAVAALDVSHQGQGVVGSFYNTLPANGSPVLVTSNVGSGSNIDAITTGTGSVANFMINNASNASSGINMSTNGTGPAINAINTGTVSAAGIFQITNNLSTAASLFVTTNAQAPALKVNGSGATGAVAAKFDGGSVGIATGTVNPTSGLDVKTSLGVSVKKSSGGTSIAIPLNDPNMVHLSTINGALTYTPPDATLCPGRILVFGFDNTITGGSIVIAPCCSQTINNQANVTYTFVGGMSKPSVGIISDGSNWHIIFKN